MWLRLGGSLVRCHVLWAVFKYNRAQKLRKVLSRFRRNWRFWWQGLPQFRYLSTGPDDVTWPKNPEVYSWGSNLRSLPATEYTDIIIVVFHSSVRDTPNSYLKTCNELLPSTWFGIHYNSNTFAPECEVQTTLFNKILAVSKPAWHIPLQCKVKTCWWWTEECPKHVDFYSKNKFGKLVRLVGFIIVIYQDERSPERQIWNTHLFQQLS